MPPEWMGDHQWARRFLPEMKRIVGEHLIGEAPDEEDQQRNTDLIVLRLEAVRVACRVRRHKYLSRYGGQFTIRQDRPSGVLSELWKVIEGWGDYILYGFADEQETALVAWTLGDLNVFRRYLSRSMYDNLGNLPGEQQPNSDGSSRFRAFSVDEMPRGFVVAQYAPAALWEVA